MLYKPVLAGRIYPPEHWTLVGVANPVFSNFLEWLGLVYWHLYSAFLECRCC